MTSDPKVLFFAGKGGVGKSTLAAAHAVARADAGRETLLVSVDPAHNLGDLFGVSLDNQPRRVMAGLDVAEVNAAVETRRYIDGVKAQMRRLVQPALLEEIDRHLDMAADAPGAVEAAVFDRLVAFLLDDARHYDVLIFDTAPTGHTLRLLVLPELLGIWVDGLLDRRRRRNQDYAQWLGDGEVRDDPIFEVLNRRRQRFADARTIMLDTATTMVNLVLTPERLPIEETARALEQLAAHEIRAGTLYVNKVLPESADSEFLRRRAAQERAYLDEIDWRFKDWPRERIPLLDGDVASPESLWHVVRHLPPRS